MVSLCIGDLKCVTTPRMVWDDDSMALTWGFGSSLQHHLSPFGAADMKAATITFKSIDNILYVVAQLAKLRQ